MPRTFIKILQKKIAQQDLTYTYTSYSTSYPAVKSLLLGVSLQFMFIWLYFSIPRLENMQTP